MIARVTLEIALRREFDYLIPPDLAGVVEVGSRVKVPFGPRQVLGVVTALAEHSPHTNLRSILKVIGRQSLVTPRVLALTRWIAGYYCCPPETALKSVLPQAVRKEQEGWRERLFVRVAPRAGDPPKLTQRQQEVWAIVEQRRELPLQELLELAETTAETVRRLEDKGLVVVSSQIAERDPYAHEHILPTEPLPLNAEQARALERITAAMTQRAAGVPPAELTFQTESPFFNRVTEVARYSGQLPHWQQVGKLYFVTFRLSDSVSQEQLHAWTAQKQLWEAQHPKPWSTKDWADYHDRFTAHMERMLDAGYGSCSLRHPEVAELVEKALHFFDGQHYALGEYVIMPNHVHVLVRPAENESLDAILHSWKSFTAKQANAVLGRSGAFWRDESFDHLVRSQSQYAKFQGYIRDNPIKAGLKTGFRFGGGSFRVPSEAAAGRESQNCRQDAGSTLGQRAADVPPAVPSLAEETNLADQLTGSGGNQPNLNVDAARRPEIQSCRRDASSTFLLHGVTGSGKTEVYLQAIARALEQGQGAIVLVPEISLTPQTVERFKARFSHGPLQTLVAVLHSHLSAGERHDEWHKIRQGRARIAIGARSAIFAPVEPLGLIVVDEEHEHSYKQEEAPRYHARDVAVVRGQREGAVVVLGSATPSMESFYNVQRGKYELLELPQRVDHKKMPLVRVIDMRQEARKEKGAPIFSLKLKEAITQRLERKEQVMLFLNRRGYATSMQCPLCGYVAECPNCSLALTYHRRAQQLRCHICGHETAAPSVCPQPKCRNPAIRYAGLGTEKVEDTLAKLFPHAKVRRMDSDVLKRKEDYRNILGDFKRGKIDILVGTQMIAKGLHFENVTLVGVIYADLSLHQADFRAGERTFQLLTQVAGRAGRGEVEGEVFVQAFTPFHPAIQYARRHDFAGFYEQEIEFREQLKYPPVSRVALLTLKGRNEEKVNFSAEHLRKELDKVLASFKDMIIAGPAPAPLVRAETYYRYQIMLRTRQMSALSRTLSNLVAAVALPEDVTLTVDIDPVNLA